MKGFLILVIGGSVGWFLADQSKGVALERCDTEVLQCQVQLSDDRAAYFREMAECQAK